MRIISRESFFVAIGLVVRETVLSGLREQTRDAIQNSAEFSGLGRRTGRTA